MEDTEPVLTVIGQCLPEKWAEFRGNTGTEEGSCACESWRERMAGKGWERFASVNFGMKDRLVCICVWICLRVWERKWVNAKERMPVFVEIRMGWYEAVVFLKFTVCVCLWLWACACVNDCLYMCTEQLWVVVDWWFGAGHSSFWNVHPQWRHSR